MDYPSLVTAQLFFSQSPPARNARAEELYFRSQATLPRPGFRRLISLATTAGLILLLVGAAQA